MKSSSRSRSMNLARASVGGTFCCKSSSAAAQRRRRWASRSGSVPVVMVVVRRRFIVARVVPIQKLLKCLPVALEGSGILHLHRSLEAVEQLAKDGSPFQGQFLEHALGPSQQKPVGDFLAR